MNVYSHAPSKFWAGWSRKTNILYLWVTLLLERSSHHRDAIGCQPDRMFLSPAVTSPPSYYRLSDRQDVPVTSCHQPPPPYYRLSARQDVPVTSCHLPPHTTDCQPDRMFLSPTPSYYRLSARQDVPVNSCHLPSNPPVLNS